MGFYITILQKSGLPKAADYRGPPRNRIEMARGNDSH